MTDKEKTINPPRQIYRHIHTNTNIDRPKEIGLLSTVRKPDHASLICELIGWQGAIVKSLPSVTPHSSGMASYRSLYHSAGSPTLWRDMDRPKHVPLTLPRIQMETELHPSFHPNAPTCTLGRSRPQATSPFFKNIRVIITFTLSCTPIGVRLRFTPV